MYFLICHVSNESHFFLPEFVSNPGYSENIESIHGSPNYCLIVIITSSEVYFLPST